MPYSYTFLLFCLMHCLQAILAHLQLSSLLHFKAGSWRSKIFLSYCQSKLLKDCRKIHPNVVFMEDDIGKPVRPIFFAVMKLSGFRNAVPSSGRARMEIRKFTLWRLPLNWILDIATAIYIHNDRLSWTWASLYSSETQRNRRKISK